MRRILRASAVAVPLILMSGFLLFARGHVLGGGLLVIAAFFLFLVFPYCLTNASTREMPRDDAGGGWLLWVRRAAWYGIIVWCLSQPELDAFLKRAIGENGLWDWRLITAVSVLTFCSIVQGLRRVAFVSDKTIYRYLTSQE